MRSGACTVQQTLTTEAASVLKHSLSLARRRGHAQVTPLHVAATLLSSRVSLLRRACLKSQPHNNNTNFQTSHPLQCRALELCFNVALNRLPTTPSPLLHAQPSLSNALIAALKRAQAHQRRGCIEQQQQQPLLTVKVELEQLIISILDDPSVSRVMREAGFSSTAVKNNIEDSSSPSSVFQYCYSTTSTAGGVFSSPSSPSPAETQPTASFWHTHFFTYSSDKNPLVFSPQKKILTNNFTDSSASVKEDIKLVLQVLLRNKRKNTVIVGDSVAITEGLIGELMRRVERGEVPLEMKQVQFVKFQFAPVSLRFMKKEDVEMNISQLKRKVESIVGSGGGGEGGAIIYTGDLRWTVDQEDQTSSSSNVNGGNGVGGYNPVEHLVEEIGKIVSSSEYKNTKVWLMATASYQTYMRCQMRQPPLEIQWALQPVSVPSTGLALGLHASSIHDSKISFSQNPSQVVETKPLIISNGKDNELSCCPECTSGYEKEAHQILLKSGHNKNLPAWLHPQKDELAELRRKWNGSCRLHHHLGANTNVHNNNNNQSYLYGSWWSAQNNNIFQDSNSISMVPKFRRQQSCSTIDFNFDINGRTQKQPNLDCLKNTDQGPDVKISLALGNSFSWSDTGGEMDLYKQLQENVPWQSQIIIHSIAQALIQSKSPTKGASYLLVQGSDILGKRKLALAIAESVLGSADLLLHMNMRKTDHEAITKALGNQEKRVVALVEDVDFADSQFLKLLETENFGESSVIILTKDNGDFTRYQDQNSVIQMMLEVKETKPARFGTPNMDHKRKLSEWEEISSTKTKNPRKDLSRQSSFNTSTLDLNIKANDDDQSPISSDLTLETISNPVTPNGFLDSIKNRFVLDRNQDQDREITEFFSSKIKKCFKEVYGDQTMIGFSIEDRVLEEVVDGYGCFVNSQMERWLKDIFQSTLETVKIGGKESVGVRLCFEGRNDRVLDNGFMGTCFPKKIQVSFIN